MTEKAPVFYVVLKAVGQKTNDNRKPVKRAKSGNFQ